MTDNVTDRWMHLFMVLATCTALILLLIWDQSDRQIEDSSVIIVETTTTTTAEPLIAAVDLGWMNTTTTTIQPSPQPSASQTGSPDRVDAFFECIRWRESGGNYRAVDSTGTFRGAYQIYQGGWDSIAVSIGRTDLVGVRPDTASVIDQDVIAHAMYDQLGSRPWGGACS